MERKVLIISYFFPPNAYTGAVRVKNISDFLFEKGLKPIVITGDWERKAGKREGFVESGTKAASLNKQAFNYPVFYQEDQRAPRLIFYNILKRSILKKIYYAAISPLLEIVELRFPSMLFYRSIWKKAVDVLSNDPSIKTVFISMGPFPQSAFGYHLKKRFPHINWIADYRDDWSTSDLYNSWYSGLQKKLLRHFERRYMSNCKTFCSVSEAYVEKIGKAIGKKGFLLANGFDEMVATKAASFNRPLFDDFTITFNGTLYETQPVEMVLEAVSQLWKEGYKIYLKFVGTGIHQFQKDRIFNKVGQYAPFVEVTDRLPREVAIDIQFKSHLLLAIGHVGLKGVVGSKTYEYIGLRKKVLLAPTDKDIIENLLTKTGQAYVCNTVEDCVAILRGILQIYRDGSFEAEIVYNEYEKYSRRHMLENLVQVLSEL